MVLEREVCYSLTSNASLRMTQWRAPNCTAYNYGYLWATHRLFYWQRDQAIVERRISDPCFGNINNPIELGFEDGGGEGLQAMRALLVRLLDNGLWTVPLTGWLSVPAQELSPVVDIDSWRATERGDEGEMSFKLRVAAHRGARLLQAFLLLALLALLAVAAWLCRSCLVLYLQLAKSSTYAEPVSRPCYGAFVSAWAALVVLIWQAVQLSQGMLIIGSNSRCSCSVLSAGPTSLLCSFGRRTIRTATFTSSWSSVALRHCIAACSSAARARCRV